jgi:predicted nuclease with TOPRIM domain
MIWEWSLLTIATVVAIFLYLQVLFYKNLVDQDQKGMRVMRKTLREAETLIRKYQVQLQRSIGNVELVTGEMVSVKNDLKGVRQSHSALKFEKKKLEDEVVALKNRIEALS